MTDPVGPFPLQGVQMPSWMVRFDAEGRCTSPQTREQLLQHLRDHPRSDVIVFSHGWNNDFDDAAEMYRDYLQRLEALLQQHPAGRPFDPLFIGIVWPSIWLDFDDGPQMGTAGDAEVTPEQRLTGDLIERAAATGHGPAALQRIQALLAQPELDLEETQELVHLLAPVFGALCDDDGGGEERLTDPDDLIFVLRAMQMIAPRGTEAILRDPGDWGEPPDDGGEGTPQIGGALGDFEPLQIPQQILRLFSLYQMKDRAGTVGHAGVAALLRDLLSACGSRVHAVGHSFGCKVLLSAVCAPAPLPRPLTSMLLLQPAVSHLCFAGRVPGTDRPGGYVAALQPDRVAAPIVTTYSRKDRPLNTFFHLALWRESDLGEVQIASSEGTSAGNPPSRFAALGGYGPRGAGELLVDPMPAAGSPYPALPPDTPVVGLDGSADLIDGHSDVRSPATAWALHRLMFR